MRRALAFLLIFVLLAASTLAVAEPGRGRGRGPFEPLGAFELVPATRAATGEHVSFTYSETGISDFRAGNRTLYDLIVTGDPDDDGDDDEGRGRTGGASTEGAQMRVRMPNFTFTAQDSPTAAAKVRTDGDVRVVFEEGVVLGPDGGDDDDDDGKDGRVRFSFGDVTGVLRGDDAKINGRTVTASGDILVILDAPRGPFDASHRDLGRAIGKGRVGAEATIHHNENEIVEVEAVSYANVTIDTLKAERGNITVLIEGHGFEGRVIVLNVDGRILGAQGADELNVMIDNASVRPASNLTDILDPDDDGFLPEYYIVYDIQAQAFQLIATLPHYSVHLLSVTTPFALPPPSVVIGVVAGFALLVPTAMLLFRRK